MADPPRTAKQWAKYFERDPVGCARLPPGSIRVQPPHHYVDLTRLPEAQRTAAWRHIKATSPELAALLKDPQLQALVQAFDGRILVPRAAAGFTDPRSTAPRSTTGG